MTGHRPRKRFGQHFLRDPAVIRRILQAIDPRPEQTLVEIGPGQGALTAPLLAHCTHLTVIELDRDLIPRLQVLDGDRLTVHQADALNFDFASLARGCRSLRLVGNLPYNISTPLLFHLLSYAELIRDMHFMLQREVVERMAAAPGSGAYGRLGIMIQYHCQVVDLFHIGPGAFTPPPRVDSAFVRLVPHETLPHPAHDPRLLEKLVKQAFAQRRKTLRNALRSLASASALESVGIDPGRRPETVSIAEYVALSNHLAETGQS